MFVYPIILQRKERRLLNNDTFFPKNKSARIAVSLLLCIPLIAAAILVKKIDPNAVERNAVQSLTVSINGSSNTFTDEQSLSVYSDITKNATEIDAAFRNFDEETPYEITFTESDGSTVSYSLYMLEDENDCIYKTSEGRYFMMDPENAKNLLVRSEFGDVNQASFLPVLTYERSGKQITLKSGTYNWKYKALDGSDVEANSDRNVSNPVVKFNSSDVGNFVFDREPDSIKITVTNGEKTEFDGTPENLAEAFSYKSDTKLDMTLVAEWYELEDSQYSGTLTYKLSALYDIDPTYSVVDDHALPKGDFTILRISDFNDGESLNIDNDLGVPTPAKVYDKTDEGIKFAFVPLFAASTVGTHTLTLSTEDGNVQTVDVSVKEPSRTFGSQTVIVTDETLQSAFTSDGFEQWKNTLSELSAKSENSQLWTGKFAYPTKSSDTVSGGFKYGTSVDVKSLYSTAYTFDGTELAVSAGSQVTAANSGKVIFADELTLTGKTVGVDHGSGVLSWYGHLSDISVNAGDSVTAETVLGSAGSTGFACNSAGNKVTMVYFGVSLGGVFIDPSSPCRFGINF